MGMSLKSWPKGDSISVAGMDRETADQVKEDVMKQRNEMGGFNLPSPMASIPNKATDRAAQTRMLQRPIVKKK